VTTDVTGIVLAGGRSMRFGRSKAFVKLNNKSLVEWTIEALSQVSKFIIIVTNFEEYDSFLRNRWAAQVIVDLLPEKAALGGIFTGVSYASTAYSIVVGCDMPFLNSDLLKYQLSLARNYDAVVPRIDDKIEPLHSVYSKSCLPSIEKLVHEHTLSISRLFEMITTRYVMKEEIKQYDPEYLSIFNINTKQDLATARTISRNVGLTEND
jgi:molybdopterin-guanine dinucleotide biosynthesis protein A